MKRFVAIYLGSATALAQWKATDDQKRKEQEKVGIDAWMTWAKENEASIVDLGSPLGKTKRINAEGISDTKNGLHIRLFRPTPTKLPLNYLPIIRIS